MTAIKRALAGNGAANERSATAASVSFKEKQGSPNRSQANVSQQNLSGPIATNATAWMLDSTQKPRE
jgi:hypothetical protein